MKVLCFVSLLVFLCVGGRPPKTDAFIEADTKGGRGRLGRLRDGLSSVVSTVQEAGHNVVQTAGNAIEEGVDWAQDRVEDVGDAMHQLDQQLEHRFQNRRDRIAAKARHFVDAMKHLPDGTRSRLSAAFTGARATFASFRSHASEWAKKTAADLDAVRDQIVQGTKDVMNKLAECATAFGQWMAETAVDAVTGFARFLFSTIKFLTEVYVQSQVDALTACVSANCSAHSVLLFGEVVHKLLSPGFATFEEQAASNDEAAASEAVAIYELACGYGNVSMWDAHAGADHFAEAASNYSDYDSYRTNFQELDHCIMSNCSSRSGASIWQVLQNGMPSHCAELLDNPARHHAGRYKVKYSHPVGGPFIERPYEMKLSCTGNMYASYQGTEYMAQPIEYDSDDVREVCHGRTNTMPDAASSTFYVQNIYNWQNDFIIQHDKLECLYVMNNEDTGESKLVGGHYDSPELPNAIWGRVEYELVERDTTCALLHDPDPLHDFDQIVGGYISAHNAIDPPLMGKTVRECALICNEMGIDCPGFEFGATNDQPGSAANPNHWRPQGTCCPQSPWTPNDQNMGGREKFNLDLYIKKPAELNTEQMTTR